MPNEQPASDDDLPMLQRAQAGELEAFDELVGKYQSAMTALLFRFAPERADLEDLVQETFVRAWRGLAGWKPEKPFLHWLKRIAVRVGLEFCRRNKRSPFSRLAADETILDRLADEGKEDGRAASDEVQFILGQIPADDRALIILLHLEEMPMAEIARNLGWTLPNTKVRAFRARRRLRALLSRHGYDLA